MSAERPSSDEDPASVGLTPEIVAEASVWIARLHGPDRSPAMERACLAWQSRSAANRLAFERCTEVWEAVPQVKLSDAYASVSSAQGALNEHEGHSEHGAQGVQSDVRKGGRRLASVALLVAAALSAGALIQRWSAENSHVTGVGEREVLVLADGTRMSLNTATRVHVEMASGLRAVRIDAGEALFEVAKDPNRPFVVRAAATQVIAHGTVFSVRLPATEPVADDPLAVTLLEGSVSVRTGAQDRDDARAEKDVVLTPGDRLRLVSAANGSPGKVSLTVDRPAVDQVLAWTRSEVIFDNASLAQAVSEMNRYSRTPIVLVGGGELAHLRVSGLYRAGDSAGFAAAIAALHGLHSRQREDRVEVGTFR